MKTFISCSGDKSKKVAALLSEWIPEVIQAVDPWYSPEDIKSGEQWLAVISSNLEQSKFGIVCLTQDNQHNPWIMYEAGALAKGTKVCPFLIDVKRSDITGPLAGTNNIEATKDGLLKLISDMNDMLDKTLDSERLKNIFERAWPDFEVDFQKILKSSPAPKTPKREDRELLEEILENTRSIRNNSFHHDSPLRKILREKPEDYYDLVNLLIKDSIKTSNRDPKDPDLRDTIIRIIKKHLAKYFDVDHDEIVDMYNKIVFPHVDTP